MFIYLRESWVGKGFCCCLVVTPKTGWRRWIVIKEDLVAEDRKRIALVWWAPVQGPDQCSTSQPHHFYIFCLTLSVTWRAWRGGTFECSCRGRVVTSTHFCFRPKKGRRWIVIKEDLVAEEIRHGGEGELLYWAPFFIFLLVKENLYLMRFARISSPGETKPSQ